MKEHKFKVGDHVVANFKANGRYNYTIPGWKGVVTEVFDSVITVEDAHRDFKVDPACFDLDTPESVKVEVTNYEIY